MAKSTRSKVKRHFRAKKRETGVYAVVEAARLERLSAKLTAIRNKDKDGDVEVKDVNPDDEVVAGSSWSLIFGLLETSDITAENMGVLRDCCR